MRHFPIKLGAAVLTVSLFACFSQAGAMPVLSSNVSPNIASPVEKASYWRHGYGYGYWGTVVTGPTVATGRITDLTATAMGPIPGYNWRY
jgi:hypothetical protein